MSLKLLRKSLQLERQDIHLLLSMHIVYLIYANRPLFRSVLCAPPINSDTVSNTIRLFVLLKLRLISLFVHIIPTLTSYSDEYLILQSTTCALNNLSKSFLLVFTCGRVLHSSNLCLFGDSIREFGLLECSRQVYEHSSSVWLFGMCFCCSVSLTCKWRGLT